MYQNIKFQVCSIDTSNFLEYPALPSVSPPIPLPSLILIKCEEDVKLLQPPPQPQLLKIGLIPP